MFIIKKEFKFCSAHQLIDSYTELCRGLHGHGYKVEIHLKGLVLDSTSCVVDFTEVKDKLKDYIDGFLDHSVMLPSSLPTEYIEMVMKYNKRVIIMLNNPSAENIARMIFNEVEERLGYDKTYKLAKVVVWETDTSSAEYTKEAE